MLRSSIISSSIMKWTVRALLASNAPRIRCRSDVTVDDSEVLNNFIDSLMTDKMNKWRSRKKAYYKSDMEVPISNDISPGETLFDVECASADDYICNNLTSPHLESILKVFLDNDLCPSLETLMKAANTFAKSGNKSGIELVISLADVGNYNNEIKKEEFKIFQAEAMWRGGESVQNSLVILHDVYKKQPGLRRFIRSSLRSLIGEVMQRRGEASLVQVKKLVLQLAGPPYDDALPLSFLWGQCILSEWFADQQISVELVNFGRDKPQFRRALENRLNAVVGQALAEHRVEAIYRVLETLLMLSLFKPAESVLGKLFDYKYLMGDKRGCEAILELCATTDLDIGSTRRKQFESAPARWMGRRKMTVAHKSSEKLQNSSEILPVPKFKFTL